jgi:hypothetical protein
MRKFHLWIIFTVDNATRRFARGDLTLVAGAQMAARGDSAKWATGVCRSGYVCRRIRCGRGALCTCRCFVVSPVLGEIALFAGVQMVQTNNSSI